MNHTPSIALFTQPPLADPAFVAAIISHARHLSLCVEIPQEIAQALPEELRTDLIIRDYPSPDCRMVLSLGGDGTFLRAARRSLYGSGAPVAGINTGTLGFLASWEREDFPRLLEMAATYRIPVRERTLLSLTLPDLPGFEPRLALNDISILRSQSSQMITVSATLGHSPLTDYTGDGLIVCTATGSTGYNLSAGGPILQPDTDALVLTPVAPHTFTQRPLVISGNEPLHLGVSGRSPGFLVSTDGVSEEFACGTRLEISRSDRRLRIVHNASEDFAARLRAKLMWGENPVTR